MSLTSGTRIGVFEVVDKIGEGGMGEVYRARDLKLDRDVALKVLPPLFTGDPDRVARFEREARMLASLNHPNIAQIYDFQTGIASAGYAAIAMELVEGPTLEGLLRAHEADTGAPGLPFDRALAILRQIAAALDAAHDRGIIHRDLKPANIKVRDDGTVKVLDFGLAKAFAADAESSQADLAQSPTLTARATQLGMIIGTAAYMSPEQAKGRAVDRRADIWAFGAVLFEMLAGRRAFDGDDVSDVLAAVLKTEPDWSLLPSDLPPPVRRLLRRCLEKDPKKRLRDVAEGMLQLDEGLAAGSMTSHAGGEVGTSTVAAAVPVWRKAVPIAATAVATAAIVIAVGTWAEEPAPALRPARFLHAPPATAPLLLAGNSRDVAISPDGRHLVYVSGTPGGPRPALQIRALDQLDAVPLRGAQAAVSPFFSPDGEWVGFVDHLDDRQLKKVSVRGGPALSVSHSPGSIHGATWTSDGQIIFGSHGPLYIVPEGGGPPAALTSADGKSGDEHVWPSSVAGTDIVLFAVIAGGTRGVAVLNGELAAFNRRTAAVTSLKVPGHSPRYVSTGHIVYVGNDGVLQAVPFDLSRLEVTGNPVPLIEGIGVKYGGAVNFDMSAGGHIVYAPSGTSGAERSIVWVDRAGRETPVAAPRRAYYYARVSPDGAWLSLDVRDQEEDIWIWDVRREALARLTDTPGADQYGLWTRDQRLIFSSEDPKGRTELYRHRPDGVGRPEQLTDTTDAELMPFPNAITPDGKQVIFRAVVGGKNDLFIASVEGDRTFRKLLATQHDERNADISPDGRFMAFESDLSGGRLEVFVRPFPNVEGTQQKVSIEGGAEPLWSSDGRELFYLADNKLMSVGVTQNGESLDFGKPVPLFDTGAYYFGGAGRNYDAAPGGKRFVMVKNAVGEPGRSQPLTIVVHWLEELRARVK